MPRKTKIYLLTDTKYYMIYNGAHLIEASSELFEIIDGRVLPLWEVRSLAKNELTFWPALFYQEDFFENFSEWEETERDKFTKLKTLLESL